jgi:hypothetical protein
VEGRADVRFGSILLQKSFEFSGEQ